MTIEELDVDVVNQFLADIGDAAPELINLFISESRARFIRMGQLTADKNWTALASEAHALKSVAKTYGLVCLGDVADHLEQACLKGLPRDIRQHLDVIQNSAEAAFKALAAKAGMQN